MTRTHLDIAGFAGMVGDACHRLSDTVDETEKLLYFDLGLQDWEEERLVEVYSKLSGALFRVADAMKQLQEIQDIYNNQGEMK